MAGELGLINSYRTLIAEPLSHYRDPTDHSAARDCDIETFVQKVAKNPRGGGVGLKNALGKPLTMENIWQDIGLDPKRTSLDNLLTLSDDIKYFAPEVVRGFINRGLKAKPWYDKLCADTVDVHGMAVVSPWVEYTDETMEVTGEAETIAEASLEWGYKMITLKKKAKSISYSDEVMFGCVLPQVGPFLERIGVQLAARMNREAVTTLVNGDIATGDECAVIGTTSGTDLYFEDFMRAWVRADMLYYEWDSLVASESMTNLLLNIDEFTRPKGFGTELVRLTPQDAIQPENMPFFSSSAMPEGQALLFDKASALLHLLFVPLRIENDRIMNRQLNATYASIIDGFTTIDRRARLIIDSSKKWESGTATDFPSWMAPLN